MIMRKILYLSMSVLFCLTLLLPSITNAHPGNTDSNGGHTCRTNCEKWGLEYGEYHYHNEGGSSDSSSETNSNSESNSDSTSNSYSNNSSNSTAEPSSNNEEPTIPSQPEPELEPEPKIDKKQVQADEHYKNATDYFNNDTFHDALEELDKIYDLDRNDSKTDELVQKSLNAIYNLAESNLDDENYDESKELLDFILDYQHSETKIKEKADELLKKVTLNEKIANLLSNAEVAKDKKEYEDAISFIYEANKLDETDETSTLFDIIIDDIIAEAEAAYFKNEFEQADHLYMLLEEHTESSELKDDYQAIIRQIQDLQLIKEKYELETIDLKEDSLFNQLMNEEKDTSYNLNIVHDVKNYLAETEQEETVLFIFKLEKEELLTRGQKNEN